MFGRTQIDDFNPLPPQGGRLEIDEIAKNKIAISIHSLPKEGDDIENVRNFIAKFISIHSLPKEGDDRRN